MSDDDIIVEDDVLGGDARIRGTRIGTYHIAQYRESGFTPEEIADEFSLDVQEVEAALEHAEEYVSAEEALEILPDSDEFEDEFDEEESSVVLVAGKDAIRIAEILREVDNEEAEYWAELLEEHAADHAVPSTIDGEPVGEVIEELAARRKLMDVIEQTPNIEPPDDLITDEE